MTFLPLSLRSLVQTPVLGAVLAASALLAGCASGPGAGPNATPAAAASMKAEDIVRERANQRWKHLLADEYSKAYDYLTPAFRAVNSQDSYRGRFGTGAKWVGAEVQSVKCSAEDRCEAVIKLQTLVVARGFSGPITTTPSETWLKEDGQWWVYQK